MEAGRRGKFTSNRPLGGFIHPCRGFLVPIVYRKFNVEDIIIVVVIICSRATQLCNGVEDHRMLATIMCTCVCLGLSEDLT